MLIYVAAPYTKGDVAINVRNACLAGEQILAKGHIPFVPHLSHLWHLISPQPYEDWLKIDLAILERCDVLLRLDGESQGADREVSMAQALGKKIYMSIDEIPDEC